MTFVRRASLALVPVTLLACGTTTPPEAPLASASAEPRPSAAPAMARSGEELCAAFAEKQTLAITRALAPVKTESSDDPAMDDVAVKELLTSIGSFCAPTSRGAWATLVEGTSERPWSAMGGFRAKWSLVHLAPDGAETKVSPRSGGVADGEWNFAASMLDPSELGTPTVFDFDGDGEQEIGLALEGHIHEGEAWAVAHLWTFRGGALKPYTPADSLHFDSFEDVDKDGRPDLVGFAEYDDAYENCCSGFFWRVTGPKLVAHSAKDGGFTYTDDVAVAFAKASCAETARSVRAGKALEEEDLLRTVACARLHGQPAAEVKADLDKVVPLSKAAQSCDSQSCRDPNTLRKLTDAWADLTPPTKLPGK